VRGYISAYDVETGKNGPGVFFTVPGRSFQNHSKLPALEKAAKNLGPAQWWESRRRRHCLGLYLLRFRSRSPLLRRRQRNSLGPPRSQPSRRPTISSSASVVALKPDTGEYVWHYQETPGDAWDYDSKPVHHSRRPHHQQLASKSFASTLPRTVFFYVFGSRHRRIALRESRTRPSRGPTLSM